MKQIKKAVFICVTSQNVITFRMGLIKKMQKEGYDVHVVCFDREYEKKIVDSNTTLSELARIAENIGAPKLPSSGRQEYLEAIVNNILFFN